MWCNTRVVYINENAFQRGERDFVGYLHEILG